DMICTGHGPVLDENPRQIVEIYKDWATDTFPEKKTVVIPYVAAYGYTKALAMKIVEGLKAAGDIDIKLYDMVYDDQAQVIDDIYYADGVLFGSPTINGDALYPIMDILMKLSPIIHHGKLAGAFGSYGWSGEAVDHINNRIRDLKMRLVKGLKVNFKPNENQLEDAFDYGKEFGEYVLGTKSYVNFEEDISTDTDYSLDHTPKLWRCVICGEIIESINAPEICPACGATSEQFEIYEEKLITYSAADLRNIVVIGNGAAGISAVEAIWERNENANITLIDKEIYTAYYKPMLSDFIADTNGIESVFLKDLDWYQDRNINFQRGAEVAKILPDKNQIMLSTEEVVDYDQLIIAAGSNCFVPPIKNAHLKGVFTLRNMDNAMAIKAMAENSRKAVIVGGGLLGLETADELKKMGLDVTVVEIFDRILPRQMDDKGARIFEAGIERTGIKLIKGATVTEIIGIDKVTGVKVNNGSTLVADIVVISAGIRSETTLAKDAGIICDRGIVVNERMQTNFDNIYAAGDVAEYKGIDYAIWPEAVEQGKVAGANAVGDKAIYENMIPSNIFNGMKMNVFSIGDVTIDEDGDIHSITFEDKHSLIYKRLIFKANKLIGGVIIGDNKKSKMLIDGMNMGATSDQMKRVFQ
nr:FAD-dependent oxidoreductase [Vallitaleaceae bacterium]